jgi:pre-mRNA-processing factor 19
MLEMYTLKQQLDTTRQELAHALYQHDAACRVIARLIKERDEARSQLGTAAAVAAVSQASARQPEAMEVEAGITEAIKQQIQAKATELSKSRKKRAVSASLAKEEDIKNYEVLSANPVHKASQPLCLDIHPTNQALVASGGQDSNIVLFNRDTQKVVSVLSGHSKKITEVLWHPEQDVLFSSSHDKTAKIWAGSDSGYKLVHTIKAHNAEVTGLSLHATGAYLATSSADFSWAFTDIATGNCLQKVANAKSEAGLECIKFHPDGLILGTGTADSVIRIWDLKTQANVATFEGHKRAVVDLGFSENGYYLATASEDGSVRLWDLRKLKAFHTISLDESPVHAVNWDYSGTYLAVAGNDTRVYAGKSFNLVKIFNDAATDVKFGNDAAFFGTTANDRSLKFYGLKA